MSNFLLLLVKKTTKTTATKTKLWLKGAQWTHKTEWLDFRGVSYKIQIEIWLQGEEELADQESSVCELLSFSFADTLLVWMCVQVEHSVLEEVSSGGKHTRLNATTMIKKKNPK